MTGRMEHEMKAEKYIDDRISSYPDYVRGYDINMDGEGKTYNTRKNYIGAVLRYLNYLKAKGYDIEDPAIFSEIKTTNIKAYFASIKRIETENGYREASGSYINTQQMALGNFFMYLVEDGIIEKTPFRVDGESIKIKKRKDEHFQIALDPSEIRAMYKNIESGVGNARARGRQRTWKERDRAIVDLALNTGIRVSALTEIDVDDVDLRNLTINVIEKGDKSRQLEIDSECAGYIADWLVRRSEILGGKKVNALFISNRKERICQDSVAAIVKKYSVGINKHVSPHKLRSTYASIAYNNTKDIQGVSKALGHGSVSITQRYLVEDEDRQREISKAVRDTYKVS